MREPGGQESSKRSAEETLPVHFWSDFSYTTSPPGHLNDLARELAGPRLSPRESARLFALLNLSLADSGIAIWESKYHYNFWRPVTALNPTEHRPHRPRLETPPRFPAASGIRLRQGLLRPARMGSFPSPQVRFPIQTTGQSGLASSSPGSSRSNSLSLFQARFSRSMERTIR